MHNKGRNVMKAVKINKVKLLTIVIENKEKHIADFVEAQADYKEVVRKLCTKNLKLADTKDLAEFKNIKAIPASPNTYESEYTRAIRMLELSVEDTIEVEQDVFNQLVLDEWHWKQSFDVSNSLYKSML